MRAATFNLYNFAENDKGIYEPHRTYTDAEFARKSAWVSDMLGQSRADVVGFQEVFSPDRLEALCREAGLVHFATVESPGFDHVQTVFTRPVCAIASKLPFAAPATTLPFADALAAPLQAMHEALGIRQRQGYSRAPVMVDVLHPELGRVTCVVLHLKSKRPMTEDSHDDPARPMVARVRDTMLRRSRGMVASMLQRGAEAASVYGAISEMLGQERFRPVVVLGDLNDNGASVTLDALRKPDRFYTFNAPRATPELPEANRYRWSFQLHDAWDSAGKRGDRPATHYFNEVGSVLDYVFVSNVFDAPARNPRAIGFVSECEVMGDHLRPSGACKTKSDHAIVLAEVLPRAALPAPPAGAG